MYETSQQPQRLKSNAAQLFSTSIRNRLKQQHFSRIRQQFFNQQSSQKEDEKNSEVSLELLIPRIEKMTLENCDKGYIKQLLLAIKNRRVEINQMGKKSMKQFFRDEQHLPLLLQLMHLLFVQPKIQQLANSPILTDIIALFANILSLADYTNNYGALIKHNFPISAAIDCTIKLFDLVDNSCGNLLIWLLFSLLRVADKKQSKILIQIQGQLISRFGPLNEYLLTMFAHLELDQAVRVSGQMVQGILREYSNLNYPITNELSLSIINILQKFWNNGAVVTSISQMECYYLNFIINNLRSRNFPAAIKSQLLTLLYTILSSPLSSNGISLTIFPTPKTTPLFPQLLQRCQFESLYYNKCITYFCVCLILKQSSDLYICQIISRFPSVIDILGDGLSLMEIDLVLQILRVVAKMVLQVDGIDKEERGEIRKKLWRLITESTLKSEINALMSHPCFEISNLAEALCTEYLQI